MNGMNKETLPFKSQGKQRATYLAALMDDVYGRTIGLARVSKIQQPICSGKEVKRGDENDACNSGF